MKKYFPKIYLVRLIKVKGTTKQEYLKILNKDGGIHNVLEYICKRTPFMYFIFVGFYQTSLSSKTLPRWSLYIKYDPCVYQ